MPTYEYECKSCAHNFEVFQSMSDEPIKKCPECGQEVRRLIFGGSGVIFKGSGFYVTDKSRSAGKSAASSQTASKTDKKPETAAPAAAASSPCAECPKKAASEKCPA